MAIMTFLSSFPLLRASIREFREILTLRKLSKQMREHQEETVQYLPDSLLKVNINT